MRGPRDYVVIVVALVALAACSGSGDADPGRTASSTDSNATPGSTSSSPSDEELGRIVAGVPKDLGWRWTAKVPSSWRRISAGAGVFQWQVSSRCSLSLEQPSGLGSKEQPDSARVVRDYATRLQETIGSQLDVRPQGNVRVPVRVQGFDATASFAFARASAMAEGGYAGTLYAYRRGDFALVLVAFCGDDQFDRVSKRELQPFLRTVFVAARY